MFYQRNKVFLRDRCIVSCKFVCMVVKAWSFIFERASPSSFRLWHFHWKIGKSVENFRRGTKANTRGNTCVLRNRFSDIVWIFIFGVKACLFSVEDRPSFLPPHTMRPGPNFMALLTVVFWANDQPSLLVAYSASTEFLCKRRMPSNAHK